MTKAEKIEEFDRDSFEIYDLNYDEFADDSVTFDPERSLKIIIKDGINMYSVAKALGVPSEDILKMDDSAIAIAKCFKISIYIFFHITGFNCV